MLAEIEFSSFYEIAQTIIGEVPVYFEWVYVIVAVIMAVAFISVILSFLGFTFKLFRRY